MEEMKKKSTIIKAIILCFLNNQFYFFTLLISQPNSVDFYEIPRIKFI